MPSGFATKALTLLAELWCDQYGQDIVSMEIVENEKENNESLAGCVVNA